MGNSIPMARQSFSISKALGGVKLKRGATQSENKFRFNALTVTRDSLSLSCCCAA